MQPVSQNEQPPSASSGFVRAISVLVGGTAAAHAITALAMPVLSRLYGPADFGALAVFTGIVSTISVAACLRYDIAVALPEADDEGTSLLALSLAAATVTALVALLVVALAFDHFSAWIGAPGIHEGKWLIPLGVFTASAWNALQSWHIRKRNFGLIARARLGQAAIASGSQAGSAMIGGGLLGLLAGPTLGFLASSVLFALCSGREFLHWARRCRFAELVRVSRAYSRFPAHSTWEALWNQAAIHLPIILIASATSTTEAGYLMLAMYVLQAPMSLLGAAIGQVYLSRAPEAHRDGRLAEFTIGVLANLIKVGAGPIIAVGILSPLVFPLVFGSGWERAGWLVTWMTPWFLFQFLASPVSMVLHVVGAQWAAMLLQFFSLLVRTGMTWLAAQFAVGVIAEAYALSGAVVYLTYFLVIFAYLRQMSPRTNSAPLFFSARWVAPWALAALLLATGATHVSARLGY